ncbi:hypothetical protein EDB85DRAFT_607150 [Lactarius pseudohatsudake]|nr:hypothetical protein EDB85DRAFT_607150 [Lactarius pseudohatsudake]
MFHSPIVHTSAVSPKTLRLVLYLLLAAPSPIPVAPRELLWFPCCRFGLAQYSARRAESVVIEHGWVCYKRNNIVIAVRWAFRFVMVANRVLPLPPPGFSCFQSSSAVLVFCIFGDSEAVRACLWA